MSPARPPRHVPRTLDPSDPADSVRRVEARVRLIDCLLVDPRIRSAWTQWATTDSGRTSVANFILQDQTIDWPAVCADVGGQLLKALPDRDWPSWLRVWLGGFSFRLGYSAVLGHVPPWTFQLAKPFATRKQRGVKRERGTGASTIARDVLWFYKAEIAVPHASIKRLGAEYSAQVRGVVRTDARSLVRDGIIRAKKALEIA